MNRVAVARRHSGRILLALLLLLATLAGAVGWHVWQDYHRFVDAPLADSVVERSIDVERGDSFERLLRRLRRLGVSEGHDLYWRALAWELGVMRRLQVGEYALFHGITPRILLQRFERGTVVQHRFTIIPGWNFRELRAALARDPLLRPTIGELDEAAIMRELGAAGVAAEGRFLPETYQYVKGTTDLAILQRAHRAMQAAMVEVWAARKAPLPLETPEQALILASIVEKETGLASERRAIAGVFVRRLQLGMLLQTDPTVIYGIGPEFDGNLTRRHLETDTPWNTYTRAGLPPTPIALPSLDALRAAVDPEPGDALYFVAKGDGSHAFSRNLAEHNAAVRQFQLRR